MEADDRGQHLARVDVGRAAAERMASVFIEADMMGAFGSKRTVSRIRSDRGVTGV